MIRESIGAFEKHLREAIALNRERAPLYAAASGGASRRVSTALIAAEWLLIPVARRFDRAAVPYHVAGVPLLEALFVSMDAAPAFVGSEPLAHDANPPVDVRALRRDVERSIGRGDLAGARETLERSLEALAAAPGLDCMLRHLLESAHRLTALAPGHIALATARGLPTPAPLLLRLLRLHLHGLRVAIVLDRWARPLQMRGIPILARDLPPISSGMG